MSFLKDLMNESAAAGTTAAHAVAGGANSLFGGGVIRRNGKKKKKLSDAYRLNPADVKMPKSKGGWRIMGEMMDSNLKGQSEESSFDPADVMSKLRDAEKQVDYEDDTVAFGMEDEDGNVVKVYVKAEQGDEFESALASMLAGADDENDEDDVSDESEIAEVLFKLKDKFDIVDVKWPEIEGDEEEEQSMEPAPGGEGEMGAEGGEMGEEMPGEGGGEMSGLEGEGGELGDLEGGEEEPDMEAEGGEKETLQQFIDMMKQDAEARQAEAEARSKEAEARAAEAHAMASANKIKQEEQVLDAEAHEKDQKAQKTEIDNLAKIAKMKHDRVSNAEAQLSGDEEEESLMAMRDQSQHQQTAPISVQKLAAELLHRLRGNIQ